LVCSPAFFRSVIAAAIISLTACGGSDAPTPVPVPVPPTPDPPTITCPSAQTAQSVDGGPTAVAFTEPIVNFGKAPETTACNPVAGSPFGIGQKTVTCTVTDALQRTASCSFSVTVREPPRLTTTSFLAFGDSITAGEDGQNSTASSIATMSAPLHPSVLFPQPQRYPQKLQQLLADRYRTQFPTVANQGQAGEFAEDRSAQSRFSSLVASRQYSVALIMEGTNDLYDRDSRAVPRAIDGLRQMIHDAKSRDIRPYLATIPPMNPAACSPVCRGLAWSLVAGFNDSVRALAMTEDVPLVEVYQGFGGDFALIGPDGLHPSADGYAKIADLFFAAIKQTLEAPSTSSLGSLRRTIPSHR
jgi:lysophospholipase L1-like esterase